VVMSSRSPFSPFSSSNFRCVMMSFKLVMEQLVSSGVISAPSAVRKVFKKVYHSGRKCAVPTGTGGQEYSVLCGAIEWLARSVYDKVDSYFCKVGERSEYSLDDLSTFQDSHHC
jgi:hypothetical protein